MFSEFMHGDAKQTNELRFYLKCQVVMTCLELKTGTLKPFVLVQSCTSNVTNGRRI